MQIDTYLAMTRAKLPNSASLGGTIRLKFQEGGQIVVHSDGVTMEDVPADCTVTLTAETLERMISGRQTP